MSSNKNKKSIFLTFLISIILVIVAFLLTFFVVSMLKNSGKIIFSLAIFKDKLFVLLGVILSVIFIISFLSVLFKYKFLIPKGLVTKSDRANSNLYDNQQFMQTAELHNTYGHYNFLDLPTTANAHGWLVQSEIETAKKMEPKLCLSLIPSTHACLVGTTGTGKSLYLAGLTIQANAVSKEKPTMIISDISGELYRDHSAQLVKQGYTVSLINLRDPRQGLRYNPLSIIWDMYHQYNTLLEETGEIDYKLLDKASAYIGEIAGFMCFSNKQSASSLEWQQGAKGIVQAVIWALLEDSLIPEFKITKDMFTIAQLSNILNRQKSYLLDFLFNRNQNSKTFDFAGNINDNSSSKTVDSYLSTLSTSLSLFLENGIQYVTSATDLNISELSSAPNAVFVVIPPEYKDRNIIGAMIYSQIYTALVDKANQSKSGYLSRTVYFLLDEFGNLPKLKDFENSIATSRKMKIFFMLMLQSHKQLDTVYGREEAKTIMNNCPVHMFLGSVELDDVKYFKELFGTYTAFSRNQNFDSDRASEGYKGSASLIKKDLVTSSELQQIQRGTLYTYVQGKKPLRTKLTPIFDTDVENIILKGQANLSYISAPFKNVIYDLEQREAVIAQFLSAGKKNTKEDVPIVEEEKPLTFENTEEAPDKTKLQKNKKDKIKKAVDLIQK